jgi:hypothetical protein
MKVCSVEGCETKVYGKGLCSRHWQRWRKHGDPLGGGTEIGAAQKFLQSIFTHFVDECIPWPFARYPDGRGMVNWEGRISKVHQIVCERFNGRRPSPKHDAAHSCGKGHLGCVNGYHLRWATRKENHADKIVHGTSYHGERCRTAKLTEADVRAIRDLVPVRGQYAVAEEFGIDQSTVSNIITGKAWRHVV